jgi:archaellum biogenesis ATPase FlaH
MFFYFAKIIILGVSLYFGFLVTKEKFSNSITQFRQSKKKEIIIFDDFERLSSKINIKELLGFIEELKNLKYKIIIVCDENKINSSFYTDFKEKVIDKVYNIESSELDFAKALLIQGLEIRNDADVGDFIISNNIINLRTIIRCNKFITNILQRINVKQEINRIKLVKTCLAIFGEDNDKIYKIKVEEEYKKVENDLKLEERGHSGDISPLQIKFENIKLNKKNILNRIYNYYKLEDPEILKLLYDIYLMNNIKQNVDFLNYYLTRINTSDPLFLLENHPDMEDNLIKKYMNEILNKLKNSNKYDLSIYPKIIIRFIKIKNDGYDESYLKKCVSLMIDNIQKSPYQKIDFENYILDESIAEEYKEVIKDLKLITEDKERDNDKKNINYFIIDKDSWAIDLIDYYDKNEMNFINKNQFMELVDIDNLLKVINSSKTKDIRDFKRGLNKIYNNGSIIYYTRDKVILDTLLQKLKVINIEKNISKRNAINSLIITLEDIISKINYNETVKKT